MIKTIIVDDEPGSRELLREVMLRYTPQLKLIGEADRTKTAISLIQDQEPDLVILDVELGDGNAFDVLEAFPQPAFRIVFVTGYDQYAIRAFRYTAVDYLLKPLQIAEFVSAVEKVQDSLLPNLEQLNMLREISKGERTRPRQIVVSHHKGYSFLELQDVVKLEASGSYVFFYMANGSKILASHNLGYYEDILPESDFFRAHKSVIVNLAKVKEYELGRGGVLVLHDESRVEVAQRRKPLLLEYLKQYNRKS